MVVFNLLMMQEIQEDQVEVEEVVLQLVEQEILLQ